jgi:hypothetical protein
MFSEHFEIENHGSIVRMLPISDFAKDWWENQVDPNCPMMGKYYCVDSRYAQDIINGFESFHEDALGILKGDVA